MESKREKVVYNITLTDESNEEITIMNSSSMEEMNRKRKRCWGLSSCCVRERSESAQMIAGKSNMSDPPTKCDKFKSCMCYPFKRRKVEGMEMEEEKLSWWKRICCCSRCCKCCKSGNMDEEKMKKVRKAQKRKT